MVKLTKYKPNKYGTSWDYIPSKVLICTNVDVSKDEIELEFSKHGKLMKVTKPAPNCAVVVFENVKHAEKARFDIQGKILGKRAIHIHYQKVL
jgi:RNA recognition motif-containing protein